MIKSIVFVVLATFFVSSLFPAEADEGVVAPVSSKLRKAAATGIPAEQRTIPSTTVPADKVRTIQEEEEQQRALQEAEKKCWEIGIPPTPTKIVSCLQAGVECSGGGLCCADMASCVDDGTRSCQMEGVFTITNLNQTGCVFQYTCCEDPLNDES